MALVTCSKCGKMISDNSSACIHCGEIVKVSQSATLSLETCEIFTEKTDESLSNFDKMVESAQLDLENEFLRSDISAMKYRRKGVEIKKYASNVIWLFLLARILLVLQKLVIENLFNGAMANEKMIEVSFIFLVGILGVWATSIVFWLYTLISYRSKLKKFLYYKKFQQWLKDTKKIHYEPNLMSTNDKKIFDQINPNTMKF